ncbi:MAG: bifunctional NADP-dependent methylenetetrahydromethanopterin dehydrogenase/methylenetetrahydrofolate dehydrogenase [Gemmataceae bacterium]|nr:bifunctional NADP-dependent methylenetetrahydromethanopterin dehydrogenase/methylenetetrahydrofolate dehydrogenase [Gemmataceae bacterium]
MSKKKIILQIDSDQQANSFDRVVALDAGADEVFAYGAVRMDQIQAMVHGLIFTRGQDDLKNSAIMLSGSDLAAAEFFLGEVKKAMLPQFGLQVSILLDPNGANTTAAAAVHSASKHANLAATTALVLGGTGPVGQRVCRLLCRAGATVRIGSRQKERADAIAASIRGLIPAAKITSASTASTTDGPAAMEGVQLIIACGAAGTVLLPKKIRETCLSLRVAIDLNAVPPAGIEGIEPNDKAAEHEGVVCYGAIGIGNIKMKLQKAAIQQLFTRNDLILDAEQVLELAATL